MSVISLEDSTSIGSLSCLSISRMIVQLIRNLAYALSRQCLILGIRRGGPRDSSFPVDGSQGLMI